MIFVLIMCFW